MYGLIQIATNQNLKTKTTFMFKRLLFIVLVSVASTASYSQPSPVSAETVYKEWQVLPDSKNMVEIFYCVVKCNGVNKVQLMVFNDGAMDQNIQISLAIINNTDNQTISVNKKFHAQKGVFHKATCDSDLLSELKIVLPDSYDPFNISVKQLQ